MRKVLFLLPMLLMGCAAKNQYVKELQLCQAENATLKENQKELEASLREQSKELSVKNEMLSRFNLVDEKGYLRTPIKQTGEKVPTGKEKWQK